MAQRQRPSNGRIVHFSRGGDHHLAQHESATVCNVHSDELVNVSAIDRHGNVHAETSVAFDPTGNSAHSWHWPEFVPPIETEEAIAASSR